MALEWTFPNYYYYFFYKICFVLLSCCPVYICNFMPINLLLIISKVQTEPLLQIVCKAVECSDPREYWSLNTDLPLPVSVGSSGSVLTWSKVVACKQQMRDFFWPLSYLLGVEVTNHAVPNFKAHRQSQQTMRSSVSRWDLIDGIKPAEYILK